MGWRLASQGMAGGPFLPIVLDTATARTVTSLSSGAWLYYASVPTATLRIETSSAMTATTSVQLVEVPT